MMDKKQSEQVGLTLKQVQEEFKQNEITEKARKIRENSAESESSHKHDYSSDKSGWVVYKNNRQKKIKLRAFIRKMAQELVFLDKMNIKECREKLIEQYNQGGVDQVESYVHNEFVKEIGISFQEVKDLEKLA